MFITPDKMDGKRISYDYVVQQYKIQQLLQRHYLISLSDICEEITSGIKISKKYYTNKNGYKIIAPGDIRNETIYINELKIVQPEKIKEKDIIGVQRYKGDHVITVQKLIDRVAVHGTVCKEISKLQVRIN
jgi:hypothetical protein